MQAPDELP